MNWNETRRRLVRLATGRADTEDGDLATTVREPRGMLRRGSASRAQERAREAAPRAASLCIASGKGGTGKSVVTASLASSFSTRGKTLIVDADLGVGNAHILQDVSPTSSFVEVVEGKAAVKDVLLPCGGQIDLLAAGSGVPRMADLSKYETHLIASGLEELELDYRHLVVDSAAGISSQTLGFAKCCDQVLVVTTPDLTAMTDAYAFVKVLSNRRPGARPLLVVNRAFDEEHAQEVSQRIQRVCRRFLGEAPELIGWLPEDRAVPSCVNRRGAVVALEPQSPFAVALEGIAVRVLEHLSSVHPRGLGRTLLEDTGYPSHFG